MHKAYANVRTDLHKRAKGDCEEIQESDAGNSVKSVASVLVPVFRIFFANRLGSFK